MRTRATALDVDGSVVMLRLRDDFTSDITVLSPDGTRRAITGPTGIVSASFPDPSVDRGIVAWWQVALDGKSAQLWVSEPDKPEPRVLHTELTPKGLPGRMVPDGWLCVAGDRIAWTMLSGGTGVIGVTSLDGTTHHLGPTKFPTAHRDGAAELQGRRLVAVNLDLPGFTTMGQTAHIDLDEPSPEAKALKMGTYPGGSSSLGTVVGYWPAQHILQFPGGVWVPMPPGSVVTDITTDGDWVAARVRRPGGPRKNSWKHELFHVPTGAYLELCRDPYGVVDIRAGRVLWSSRHEGFPHGSVTSWVGELQAPRAPAATTSLATPPPPPPA